MAEVKRSKTEEKVVINMTELVLQSVDRSKADVRGWYYALQTAEQISYPNTSRLLDLMKRSELDLYLSGLIEKRVTAVLNKNLHYEIKGKRVDDMEDYINTEKFRLMMRRLWEKKAWGFTGLCFIPGKELDFEEIPRKHIRTNGKIIAIEQGGYEGIDYSKQWNILVVEDVEKFGLLHKCVPHTILKSGSLSDLAQYIEMYGQPIRKGTYPGDDPEAKAELKRALKEAGASLSMVLPEGTTVEIIGDHVTNGDGKAHQAIFTQINNELSVIWLGNTETTGNQNGGSNAKSQEQGKQQDEIIKSDLKDVQDVLNSTAMKTILKSYGWPCSPEDGGRFEFEKEIDLAELTLRKDIDIAISAKVPVDDDYFYNTYGIEKPKDYDKLKKQMEEEKMMKLAPKPMPGAQKIASAKPRKDKKPKPKNLSEEDDLNWIEKFRTKLADFFDPAP